LANSDIRIKKIDTYNAQIITIQAVKDLIKENEELKEKLDKLKASFDIFRADVSNLLTQSTSLRSHD
jgi:uncharacterized membrane-anchored protein YhcB (DUF1043 family)|tara:strand:- start:189 stop:389 length:201 start_codon:yes stop_codon:yes gene_type:complete